MPNRVPDWAIKKTKKSLPSTLFKASRLSANLGQKNCPKKGKSKGAVSFCYTILIAWDPYPVGILEY